MNEPLVKAENVSKKFCRDLKRSLWYGVKDMGSELMGKRKDNPGNQELRKDEFWAVDDVSFELKRGECLGLIGKNGAGKSTLLKMLNGLIKPDGGRIEMHGRVGALIQLGAGFNPILTGRENIYINGSVLGFSKSEIDKKFDSIVEFSEIGDFIDTPVQNYSSGMKVRLGFAVASHMEPDVLLIDEVLAVGDLGFQIKCINKIIDIKQDTAVIFVSHSMPNIARMTNKILLLNKGNAVYYGNDVAEGIEQYYDFFETEQTQSSGTKNVTVHEINIYDSLHRKSINDQIPRVKFGQDFFIDLEISVISEIKYFTITCIFMDKGLKYVAGVSNLISEVIFKNSGNRMHIKTKIVNNFNSGVFSVNVAFTEYKSSTDEHGKGLAYYKAIKSFKSYGTLVQSGYYPVHLDSTWESENIIEGLKK
ncbi:MAG: ATP-binding cassette domain-containing protein [Bacteroidetes bacterium]|nr:ATP-binding cassette domain-containing protein [Bacteroidota bacterium]